MANVQLTISLRGLRAILVTVLVALVIAGVVADYAKYVLNSDSDLVAYFDLSEEQNFPTWWSSVLLLACAALLWAIAAVKRNAAGDYVKHWAALAAIFCYISVDEAVQIHEFLNLAPGLNDLHGIWYYGWVVPGAILVAVFAASYFRFLLRLPKKTRNKFAVAGVVYVGGALGIELILGSLTEHLEKVNFAWEMLDLVEESMEIIGSSLFLYALVEYLGTFASDLRIRVNSRSSTTA